MYRSVCFFLALVLIPLQAPLGAVFEPDDRLVSDPSSDMVDPEFDPVGNRVVWQDTPPGDLWLADIDPDTGAMTPVDGKGILVDTGLANLIPVGNGPEFGFGAGEVFLCYTKQSGDTWQLGLARQDINGDWVPSEMTLIDDRWRPICTPPGTPDLGRMSYIQEIAPGEKAVGWRDIDDPDSERTFTGVGGAGGRWVEGQRAFVSATIVDLVTQLFWVDIDTEEVTQITFDGDQKYNTFAWHAPEFDEILISTAINFNRVGIYRKIDDVWTRINTLEFPSRFEFVTSPEPFVHNGKSFVTAILSKDIGVGPLEFVPAGPSEVWIANIDPDQQFFRRIDSRENGVRRSEPEYHPLSTGPAMFYTESAVGATALLRVADTGLGSPTAGDTDADGLSDDRDNCTIASNPRQLDPDADGFGNGCDPDLNNNCTVDITDFLILRSLFGSTAQIADLNGDGVVNWGDFTDVMQPLLFQQPGPSPAPTLCDPGP